MQRTSHTRGRLLSLLAAVALSLTMIATGPTTADAHEACTAAERPTAEGVVADVLEFANVFSAFLKTDAVECVDKGGNVTPVMAREWKGVGSEKRNNPQTFGPCEDGMSADTFACDGVDMLSHVSMEELGLGQGDVPAEVNDIWGWTDTSAKGKQKKSEYALLGSTEGTVFVNISDAKRPVVLGMLPTASEQGLSSWRDIKVFDDHAFIGSEHNNHGVQVFDLTRLRGLDGSEYEIFDADARYTGMGSSHNLAINEDTGFLYALGSGAFSSQPLPFGVETPEGQTILATGAQFGRYPTVEGVSATFVDTASTACNGVPLPDLTGTIAIVNRGACAFTDKVFNTQQAGAEATIVININPGEGYFTMSGTNTDITIPSFFLSFEAGEALRADLPGDGRVFAFDPEPVCGDGLHMIDINDPTDPTYAGCSDENQYVHDTQCVVYEGPDAEHNGKEICFNSNGIGFGAGAPNDFSIVDVSDKSNPITLANVPYAGSAYSHQGWLTPDQGYFLFGDEGDELTFGVGTTTRVWDVSDLENPFVANAFENTTDAIDHNVYTEGDLAFASNYEAGLRVYDASDPAAGLTEVGFFDMYPESDDATFDGGTWSNYPYYSKQKNVVAVSSVDRGLFILRADADELLDD